MVKRKVNRVGTSTLTVSLPSKWAKMYGVKPGDEIELVEDNEKLLISPQAIILLPKKATIHLKKGQPFMRRFLNIKYRDGYDEIEVTSEDPLDQERVKVALSEVLGFELVENQPKRIVAKNIATPNESELDNIFRRLFLLDMSMAKSALEDIKTGEYTHAKEIAELEGTTNKFFLFCQRVLVKKDLGSRLATMETYRSVGELEQIGDHLKHICITLSDEKTKLSKPVVIAFEHVTKLLENLFTAYYKPELDRLIGIKNERTAVFEEIYSLLHRKGMSGPELEIASLMLGIAVCVKCMEIEISPL